ncbi:MAG: AAA family ATPase [Caulobacteraceae bacterium]
MDRFERDLLRAYALKAVAHGVANRARRPSRALARWLFEQAEALGVAEPVIDPDVLEERDGRIDRETWAAFAPMLARVRAPARTPPPPSNLERRMIWLCETLGLGRRDADLLRAGVRFHLFKRVEELCCILESGNPRGEFNVHSLAILSGAERRQVGEVLQPGRPLRLLGLLDDHHGGDFAVSRTVLKIARLEGSDPERLRGVLVGKPRRAQLAWEDFAHLGEAAALAERVLAGALAARAEGINVLLYGPPGTGKTEFARTLAERIGAKAMFVGESGAEDEEPDRGDRIAAYAVARSLAARAGRTLLVIDEADDIFTGVDDDDAASRAGSKVFMNRLVERTAAPTLWITNHHDQIGAAVLRRMTLAVRFPRPGTPVRRRIVERIARRRKLRLPAAALDALAGVRAAPAVMDLAVRAAKLSGGRENDVRRAALSIVATLEGAPAPALTAGGFAFDPALSAADCNLARLADRVTGGGERASPFAFTGRRARARAPTLATWPRAWAWMWSRSAPAT